MDARDIGVGHALLLEPLDAPGMGFARAERADIEAVARERMEQRRIVDLRIMRERDEGRVAVDIERRQRHVRPFGDDPHIGKALRRSKRRARIDDGHVVIEKLADRRQRLADMHGADDDELRRRHIDGEEDLALRRLFHAALAGAQMLGERRAQRILGRVGRLDEALLRRSRHW